jgi:hypothetical protein
MKLEFPSNPRLLVTGFTGLNKLDMSSFGSQLDSRLLSGVTTLSGLRSLHLDENEMDDGWMGQMTAWAPSLTGLTYLSMAKTNVCDSEIAALAPFLPSLNYLNLNGCSDITLGNFYSPPFEASFKALTHLSLSSTHPPGFERRGIRRSERTEVCSFTALTRLEMLDSKRDSLVGINEAERVMWRLSEAGMRALASLTGLAHLELENVASDEGMIAISSLTAMAHLHLNNPCYGMAGIRALACLTALTHLVFFFLAVVNPIPCYA